MNERRAKFRKGLSNLYLPIYDVLCNQLPSEWQPCQGLRTIEEQDALYAQGRTLPGNIVTRAKGGESAHNYGCATDWCIFEEGKPIWDARDKRWKDYEYACAKAGAKWGGIFGDFPHNELPLTVSWKTVAIIRREKGEEEATQYIRGCLIC